MDEAMIQHSIAQITSQPRQSCTNFINATHRAVKPEADLATFFSGLLKLVQKASRQEQIATHFSPEIVHLLPLKRLLDLFSSVCLRDWSGLNSQFTVFASLQVSRPV